MTRMVKTKIRRMKILISEEDSKNGNIDDDDTYDSSDEDKN